jgi:hypothetical protein
LSFIHGAHSQHYFHYKLAAIIFTLIDKEVGLDRWVHSLQNTTHEMSASNLDHFLQWMNIDCHHCCYANRVTFILTCDLAGLRKEQEKHMAIKERRSTRNSLWRVKPVDLILKQSEDQEHGLKRTLGPFSITLLGIGAIVGTGIVVLTGVAAAKYAGPGLIFCL